MTDKPTEAMIEAGKILPHSMSSETALAYEKRALTALARHFESSAPQEPDDELIERLKDMRDFCRGTTHTHPHPNNVARLCEDVLAVLQAKAPETD